MAVRSSDTWLIVALCACAYLYSFPFHPEIANPNERLRLYMTAALVEDGTFAVNEQRKRWGWVNDAAVKDGRYYSVKAPGTSFLGVPGYALLHASGAEGEHPSLFRATWIVRLTGTILPILFFLFFFHRFLRRNVFRAWTADVAVFALALGSGFYAHTMLFASHSTAGAAAAGALMLLVTAQQNGHMSRTRAFFAGLLVAGVTWFEYHGLVASLALSVYALSAVRPTVRLVPFALGGLLPTLSMMWFQWASFGNPLTPGHKLLENKAYVGGHKAGFWGISEIHWEALGALPFQPAHGLFPMTPLFLLAVPGFVVLARSRRWRGAAWTAIAACLVTLFLISTLSLWRGGWSVGPRYLTLLMPFVAWGTAVGLDRVAIKWPRPAFTIAAGALVASLVYAGTASAYYPHIPRGIAVPLTDFFWVALRDGFAPYNLLNFVGVWGTLSMLPLVPIFAAAVWLALRRFEHRRGGALLASLGVLVVCLLPSVIPTYDTKAFDVAHSFRNWSPAGEDRAARLEARREEVGDNPPLLDDLIETYERERRTKEARRVRRAKERLLKEHGKKDPGEKKGAPDPG